MKQILFFILIHFGASAQASKIDFNTLIAETQPLSKAERVSLSQSSNEPGFFTENASPHDQEVKIKIRRKPTTREMNAVRNQMRKKLERIKTEAAARKLNDKKKNLESKDPVKISLVRTKKHVAGSTKVKVSQKNSQRKRAKEISHWQKSEMKKKMSSQKKLKTRLQEAKLTDKNKFRR